jgi:beta-phosphoglucomutase family hydrolase
MPEDCDIITSERFDAVLFDLDGVLTDTASVHATCWKKMFDAFLQQRAEKMGDTFKPFEIDTDYVAYVDGKARYEGVLSFLESRGISLSYGTPEDSPDMETVCGLGNRKANMVLETLENDGVEVYEGSVRLVRHLRELGIKTAVVSSSKNCKVVLKAAGITDLFDTRVDGLTADEFGLPSKPSPAMFLHAADILGTTPWCSVVVEDAISGVEAGRAGRFGMVVGVDRKNNPDALRRHGANVVVKDLGEMIEE